MRAFVGAGAVILCISSLSINNHGVFGWEAPLPPALTASSSCNSMTSRRKAFLSLASVVSAPAALLVCNPSRALAVESLINDIPPYPFEARDRKFNQGAVIRDDYWYLLGRTPPRQLLGPLKGDDPQWNAFGSCTSNESTGNSCTYVSLNQRIPAYSKYSFALRYGAQEYQRMGQVLQDLLNSPATNELWQEAASFVTTEERSIPPAIVDAELKMVLFATAMITSPNFPGPSKELLVARFYSNEAHYAARQMASAIQDRDVTRLVQAW